MEEGRDKRVEGEGMKGWRREGDERVEEGGMKGWRRG